MLIDSCSLYLLYIVTYGVATITSHIWGGYDYSVYSLTYSIIDSYYLYLLYIVTYEVTTITRLLKIIDLFCRI